MLNAIVDAALRYKVLVLVAFAVIVGLGIQAFREVPVDAFPDVTPIQVNVYTESPGLAAEDVERLLTTPIEGAMAGLPGVEEVRSVSLFGLSHVGVYFKGRRRSTSPAGWSARSCKRQKNACRKATASRCLGRTARALARCSGTRSSRPTTSCRRWTCARCTIGPSG